METRILPHRTDKETVAKLEEGDTIEIIGYEQTVICTVDSIKDNEE